jgi:hypothetical protein
MEPLEPRAEYEEEETARVSARRPPPPQEEGYADEPSWPRRGVSDEDERNEHEYRERDRWEGLSAAYSINLGGWFEYAKAHYSAILGPMIGYMLIYVLIVLALGCIPYVGPLIRLFLDPALQAGFFVVALAQLKGKAWSFGDFFAGFQWYGALLANSLLTVLIVLGCMLPSLALFVGIAVATEFKDETLLYVAVAALVVNYLPTIYIVVRATTFNVPLIIDRNFGPIEAIQGSWLLSRGHFWGLFGVSLVLGLILLGGYLLCLVGLLFTAPYALLTACAGYLLIAGTQAPRKSASVMRRPRDDVHYYEDE